jgi:ribonuclease T2
MTTHYAVRTMARAIAGAAALVGAAVLNATPSIAQRAPDAPPSAFSRGPNPYAAGRPKAVTQPGQFDYYVLALSWSPSYCAGLQRNGYDPQCNRRDGKRYSFVLHGLWPQFERGWPQDCPTADRGFVPRPVADRMLDIMPSDKLVFHEYRKHGTCSGLGVDGYFDLSRKLYNKVKLPERYTTLSDPRLTIAPGDMIKDFLAVNPGLKPDALAVQCGGPGNRLQEVRVCFDKQGEFRSCGRNEDQRKLCSAPSMYVPPVRSGGSTPGSIIRSILPGVGPRI